MDKDESTTIWKAVCRKTETESIIRRGTEKVNQFQRREGMVSVVKEKVNKVK